MYIHGKNEGAGVLNSTKSAKKSKKRGMFPSFGEEMLREGGGSGGGKGGLWEETSDSNPTLILQRLVFTSLSIYSLSLYSSVNMTISSLPSQTQISFFPFRSLFNPDITAPAAVVAIGLIYLKTNNQIAASVLESPQTYYSLRFHRPVVLLLSALCRSLVLWGKVGATREWIVSCFSDILLPPGEVSSLSSSSSSPSLKTPFRERDDVQVGFLCTLTGVCLGLGYRFAGLLFFIILFSLILSSSPFFFFF